MANLSLKNIQKVILKIVSILVFQNLMSISKKANVINGKTRIK